MGRHLQKQWKSARVGYKSVFFIYFSQSAEYLTDIELAGRCHRVKRSYGFVAIECFKTIHQNSVVPSECEMSSLFCVEINRLKGMASSCHSFAKISSQCVEAEHLSRIFAFGKIMFCNKGGQSLASHYFQILRGKHSNIAQIYNAIPENVEDFMLDELTISSTLGLLSTFTTNRNCFSSADIEQICKNLQTHPSLKKTNLSVNSLLFTP